MLAECRNKLEVAETKLDRVNERKNEAEESTLLGEGAFGKVYKQTMAVKKIEKPGDDSEKEVKTLMGLNHENIIKYYSHYLETDGKNQRLCIAMEFAGAGTLTDLVDREAQNSKTTFFQESDIWAILKNISSALNYLHTLPEPILHRDLKPDNILGVNHKSNVTKMLTWKLGDFGLVKRMAENAPGNLFAKTFCGTRGYMAPEVVFIAFNSVLSLGKYSLMRGRVGKG